MLHVFGHVRSHRRPGRRVRDATRDPRTLAGAALTPCAYDPRPSRHFDYYLSTVPCISRYRCAVAATRKGACRLRPALQIWPVQSKSV
eukprot:7389330-Prymnesium_polylepis.2